MIEFSMIVKDLVLLAVPDPSRSQVDERVALPGCDI